MANLQAVSLEQKGQSFLKIKSETTMRQKVWARSILQKRNTASQQARIKMHQDQMDACRIQRTLAHRRNR